MITNFKIFEIIQIGYNFAYGMFGSIINQSYYQYLPNIIDFLKGKQIDFELYYNPKNFMIILFTNSLKDKVFKNANNDDIFIKVWNPKEKRKFPKDRWDNNEPYLPIFQNDEEIEGITIKKLYQDHIENSTKINNIEDLEQIISASKYNI